jgi:plasmid maintenance system antidote protein VapI
MKRDKEKYNEYQQEYKRRKRSQKVEEFEETIKGVTLEEYPDYIIRKSGKIYSRLTCKKIIPTKRGGYYYTRLITINKDENRKRGSVGVHILVAKAYHSNPENLPIVNHKDGNGFNNRRTNLEWVSHSRSIKHAYDSGLRKPAYRPVLQFEKDGAFVRRYESIKEASNDMDCHPETIGKVCRGIKPTARGYLWEYETQLENIEDKDGEEWKTIKDHPKYKISSTGRVYSEKTHRYLKQANSGKEDMYNRVKLDNDMYYVHCLVANAFLGPPSPKLIKPVVDHIDTDLNNNTLSNLQWVEFNENISFAHNRDNSHNHRKVCQYSLDGEKIGEYKHAAEAAKKVDISSASISKVCNREKGYSSAKDYIWRYADEPLDPEDLKDKKAKTRVLQYNLNGDFLKEFSSIAQASKETNIIRTSISQTCRGILKTAGGFQWKYKGDEKPIVKIHQAGQEIAIVQFSLTGNTIKKWKSATEAAKELGIQSSHIASVCKGNRNTTGGYKWVYEGDSPSHPSEREGVKVLQYSLSGNLLNEYSSIVGASKETGIDKASISQTCRGRTNTAGGFQWKYKDRKDSVSAVERKGKKTVVQYSLKGKRIREWESAAEAGRELNIERGSITAVCRGRRNMTGGYRWEYA